ncbi:MAG: glycosyltransferase [Chitinophagaceae bacterium]|nr:glycosyltransferase [Chitinophagaceae bacterium]
MKYKILHIIPTLGSGGAERQLVNLVTYSDKEEFEHIVCVIREEGFFGEKIKLSGHKLIALHLNGKYPFLKASLKLKKIIKDYKPDILHSWLYDANITARLALLFSKKIPLITSLQATDYEPYSIKAAGWNSFKVKMLKKIDQLLAFFTKPYFVACSEFVRSSYIKNFRVSEENIQVIYNSFAPDYLISHPAETEKLKNKLFNNSNPFVILNIGRLDPQKNQKTLLKAFAMIHEKMPDARLLIVGSGFLENELKKLATSLNIEKKTLFLGRRSDINELLEITDVFAFPSYFEGFGIALAEAMFKSVSCIASNIEVLRELISHEENGILVKPDVPEDWAQAIYRLYSDFSLRKKISENAKLTAIQKFHIKNNIKLWEILYRNLAK